MTDSHHHIVNALLGASVAATGYAVNVIAQAIENMPTWVREFGAPTVMLGGTVWALVHVWKELREERIARIIDRDRMIGQMREDAAKADTTRESLLRATLDQTNEFRNLRRELTRNGHHKPAENED